MASSHISAGFLLVIAVGCVSDAFWSKHRPSLASPTTPPAGVSFLKREPWRREPSKTPHPPVTSQLGQTAETPLAWRYPGESESTPEVRFERREPVPTESVAAECWADVVRVEVRRDLLGNGQPIQPTDLTLGDCESTGMDASNQVILYESDLQACGSQLTMTEDSIIYTFTLYYEPQALADTPIVKTSAATIDIQCHYARKQNVSSSELRPNWMPYSSTKVAEESLYFSLKLMTDDWQHERRVNLYFLGNVINIEASIEQYNHRPLRVFVDYCVAFPEPERHSEPRYSFIQNFGCLVDAKLTGSKSKFLPRSQDDKLQIQLEAFVFPRRSSQLIYMTCHLRAEAASSLSVSSGRACSFIDGWRSADGDDGACHCCETSCSTRRTRDLRNDVVATLDQVWEGETTLGPIKIQT